MDREDGISVIERPVPLTLLTGDLPFAGHTITRLCQRVALHDPYISCDIEPAMNLRRTPEGAACPRDLTPHDIVHLGNNPHSVPLVIALQRSRSAPTVVLHDLWLFDLVEACGVVQGVSNHALRVLTTRHGVRAGRRAQEFRSGLPVPREDLAPLASTLLAEVLPSHARVLVHRDSDFVRDVLAMTALGATAHAPLPLYYAGSNPPPPRRPARWDAVVSGTGSFARRMPVVIEALNRLSGCRPIRLAIAGGMTREAGGLTVAPGSTVDLLPHVDDAAWADLHRDTRVGIRLGVGHLGEGSGLVRDYLAFGMTVVTDDAEPPVSNHGGVIVVPSDADAAVVADAVLRALATQERSPTYEDRTSLAAYASRMRALATQGTADAGTGHDD